MENKIKALLEERRIKEKEEMKELEFKMEYLKNKNAARKVNRAIMVDLKRQIKRNHDQIIKMLEKGDMETVRIKMLETEEMLNELIELEKKDEYFKNMELKEGKGYKNGKRGI